MPDNCYWIEEVGAFETCAVDFLPPLPGDFVFIDPTPEVLSGRVITNRPGAPFMKLAASPDVIVAAFTTSWGEPTYNYSLQSHLVCTSVDHGFTFSGGLDKTPFLVGSVAGGYDASEWNYTQYYEWFGAIITYDDEAGEFFSIDTTMNNDGRLVAKVRTSRSVDGINWSSVIATDVNHTVMICEAYNGTLYYLGINLIDYWDEGSASYALMSARASVDGGVSWNGQIIGGASYESWSNPNYWHLYCSANAQGLHILNVDNNDDFYYIRPTSTSTWAAPVLMFASTEGYERSGCIVASRTRPGEIYVFIVDTQSGTSPFVKCRKSSDNGLNWGSIFTAWLDPTDDYVIDNGNSVSQNMAVVVELDDGRLVLVALGIDYTLPSDGDNYYMYAVNEDGLDSGFGAHTILNPDGIRIGATSFAVYEYAFVATQKGNDVVLSWTNDYGDPIRSLVFRP